jgi:hypothetical protein
MLAIQSLAYVSVANPYLRKVSSHINGCQRRSGARISFVKKYGRWQGGFGVVVLVLFRFYQ